jgi:hypothetical protein
LNIGNWSYLWFEIHVCFAEKAVSFGSSIASSVLSIFQFALDNRIFMQANCISSGSGLTSSTDPFPECNSLKQLPDKKGPRLSKKT